VEKHPRWDVTDPGFLVTVLRIMVVLGVITIAVGVLIARQALNGLLSGTALAIMFYLAALIAGWLFLRTRNLILVMLWLLGSQMLLFIGMAVLLAVVKVDGAGFAIGAWVLPGAIILATLYWWLVKNKGIIP
jgi:hypothetical protein